VKTKNLDVLRSLHNDESGQDLVEYSFLVALIALGAVASMSSLAGRINSVFSALGSILTSAGS